MNDWIFVKCNKKQRVLKTLQILHADVSGPRVIIHVKVRGLRGCDCEEWSGHLAANGASLVGTMKFVHKVHHPPPPLTGDSGFYLLLHHTDDPRPDAGHTNLIQFSPGAPQMTGQRKTSWSKIRRKMVSNRKINIRNIWMRCPRVQKSLNISR